MCASERLKSLLPAGERYTKDVPQESGWWSVVAESEGVYSSSCSGIQEAATHAEVSTIGEVQSASAYESHI